jgi:hypothetical protein
MDFLPYLSSSDEDSDSECCNNSSTAASRRADKLNQTEAQFEKEKESWIPVIQPPPCKPAPDSKENVLTIKGMAEERYYMRDFHEARRLAEEILKEGGGGERIHKLERQELEQLVRMCGERLAK